MTVLLEPQPAQADAEGLGPKRVVGAALQPTLDELSRPGRWSAKVPHPPADALERIPASQRRSGGLGLPELNEP